MKFIKYSIALILGLSAISCSEKMIGELPAPATQEDQITIRAAFTGEDITKVGASNGFSWHWSNDDKISVTADGTTQVFKIVEGFSAKNAEFVGKAVEGESFTIQYPESGAATANFSSQTQSGNDNTAHLKYYASLEGVDDYTSFAFNNDWAAEHKGTLKQTGLFKIIMTLPDTVKTVEKVTITADNALFFSGNSDQKVKSLELNMNNTAPDAHHVVTAWMTTSWNEATVAAGEYLTVSVKIGAKSIERGMEFTKEGIVKAGKINVFEIDNSAWTEASHYSEGRGTESNPWVIYTLAELLSMKDDLLEGGIRYFKLGADIDMKDVTDWRPLNGVSPFAKQIDFNGNGHTIKNFTCTCDGSFSYPSFFGVLWGKCYDLTFTNATITTTAGGCGILGGYGGTSGKHCSVENVHVQGTVNAVGKAVGGLFGTARDCEIRRCSADVNITNNGQNVGGLFGADNTDAVYVYDCYTAGILYSNQSVCGGLVGDLTAVGSSIYNSYSTMKIQTQFIFGGIVGRANKGQKTNAANCNSQDPKNHIEKCIAWNDGLESICLDEGEHYSNGAIIGGTAAKNYLVGCIRKPDIVYVDTPGNKAKGTYGFVDNDDASPEKPLVKPEGTGTYYFCYNGKAAAAGKTLSQVAKEIGWSAEIWDFSGAVPVHKK